MCENVRGIPVISFASDLASRGLSERSQSQQVACVREMFTRFTALDLDPLRVRSEELTDYITWLTVRPNRRLGGRLAARTVRMHVNAIRGFYGFLVRSGVLTVNPASRLSAPVPVEESVRTVLTVAEIAALRTACACPTDRGILAVFYGCGLRRSEGAALDLEDVDPGNSLLHVRSGKGGVPRSVPMGVTVKRDLTALVARNGVHGRALFQNQRGARLSGDGIYRRVKQLAVRAELVPAVTLHGLRHAIATHLLAGGLTLEQTRDFLGHGDIGVTRMYTHIDPSEPLV